MDLFKTELFLLFFLIFDRSSPKICSLSKKGGQLHHAVNSLLIVLIYKPTGSSFVSGR